MTPLQWPACYQPPVRTSWIAQLFAARTPYAAVKEPLKQQLLARPRPDPRIWGEDPQRVRIGLLLCKRIQEEYDWPNGHFLPTDPFDIVALLPWDDLEIVELTMTLEEDLALEIEDTEAMAWAGTSLENVVDRLLMLTQRQAFRTAEVPL